MHADSKLGHIVQAPSHAGTTSQKPTRARFVILALLAVGTMINYLDRTILGISAPVMTQELGIDAAIMGLIFSAFSWTYVLAQVPGGVFLDRFGSKFTYFASITSWSFATLLHGFASGFYTLLGLRLMLGFAEAPCFPTNSRVVSTWFPQQERARATSIYTVGEYIGLAFLSPVLFMILAHFGWRALFMIIGGIGIAFGLLWWKRYREPHEDPAMNQAEREHIQAGGGLSAPSQERAPFTWSNVSQLLKYRQIWGACIGQFAGNATLVFFLTWFPTYLATERHMGWVKMGFFAVLPFIAAAVGVMFGGWLSDWIIKRTGNASVGRKLPIISGLLLASIIIAANYVDNDTLVIAILSIAFFGQGMVGLGWAVISDIAPKKFMGLTGGIFNLAANLAGIITPLVVGFIVATTGSFVGALLFIGVLALIGAFSYIFILGEVKRIEL